MTDTGRVRIIPGADAGRRCGHHDGCGRPAVAYVAEWLGDINRIVEPGTAVPAGGEMPGMWLLDPVCENEKHVADALDETG